MNTSAPASAASGQHRELALIDQRLEGPRGPLARLVLDLTLYLDEFGTNLLDNVIDQYEDLCPAAQRRLYFIDEALHWAPIDDPVWTDAARNAAQRGQTRPHLQSARQRVEDRREFAFGLWDGRDLNAPGGSWNLAIRRVRVADDRCLGFIRVLVPARVGPSLLQKMVLRLCDTVPFLSGHAGWALSYDVWRSESAFDAMYAVAKRFLGVDIEYLSSTLPTMAEWLKGTGWLTMLGSRWCQHAAVSSAVNQWISRADGTADAVACGHGRVLIAGTEPGWGDRHRSASDVESQATLARALSQYTLTDASPFPGRRFSEPMQTSAWLRRFVDHEW